MMADHYKPDWLDSCRARWYEDDLARKQRKERAGALLVAGDARQEGKEAAAREVLASTPTHRNWQAKPYRDTDAIALNAGASLSSERSVIMINPTSKRFHDGRSFVLWFGACGATYLHVFADSLDDAIEACAEWLAEYMPGHITKQGDEHWIELMSEACEEAGLVFHTHNGAPGTQRYGIPSDVDDLEPYWQAEDQAMADHTRTESGWLYSPEWGISLEEPDLEELYWFVFND
jgi:hypothetical protein